MVDIPSFKYEEEESLKFFMIKDYILKYKFDDEAGNKAVIKIALKYDQETKEPVIRKLGRISKPGLRKYAKAR